MTHRISLKIDNIATPIEFDIEENTFKHITKFCQDNYPDKDWKVIFNS